MRAFSISIGSALLIACLAMAGRAQEAPAPISGPVLGFVPAGGGTAIQPILGVLGASIFGQPLDLGFDIRHAVISPKQDFALASRAADGEPVLIRFGQDSALAGPLTGARAGADMIAISPAGTAAALYAHQDKVLQAIMRPADAPQIVFESNASEIAGQLRSLAISDDGTLALLNFRDGDTSTLWALSATGARWQLPAARPTAANFLNGRHDIVVADDAAQEVFLLRGIDGQSTRIPVAAFREGFDAISGVATSDDGRQVFITSQSAGSVTIVDLTTGSAAALPCNCEASGLYRLKGNSVFRVSDLTSSPVALLDASSAEPRVIVIPPPEWVTTVFRGDLPQ